MIVAIDRCSDCREILTDEEAATGLLCDQCVDDAQTDDDLDDVDDVEDGR